MEGDRRTKEYKMERAGKIMEAGFIAVTVEQWAAMSGSSLRPILLGFLPYFKTPK
jgi:hypothetical protein